MDYQVNGDTTVVRLYRGESLFGSLERLAAKLCWQFGSLVGIGAATDFELGQYRYAMKDYHRQTFEGEYEIVSLVGNCSLVDGQPFFHIHACLADDDFSCVGGHVFNLTINATCEMFFTQNDAPVERLLDKEVGLKLLSLHCCDV